MTVETPNPVDVQVGANIRRIRRLRGVSQSYLAQRLGLSFQQLQKYERGANRVSASKLYDVTQALQVPVAELFAGLSTDGTEAPLPTPEPDELGQLSQGMTPAKRRLLLTLARELACDGADRSAEKVAISVR